MKLLKLLLVCGIVLPTMTLLAVPPTLDYQGRLTDASGDTIPGGDYELTFTINDAVTDGTVIWTEVQIITVQGGLFSAKLGSVTPIVEAIFNNDDLWLAIRVGTDPELVPRTKLSSVPYSFKSTYSDTAAYAENSATGDDGDWAIDGSNIYRLTGNVGIGENSPGGPLRIKRAISSGGGAHLDLNRTDDVTSQIYLTFGTGTHQDASIGVPSNRSDILSINADRIGIGMGAADPKAKLHINGDQITTGSLRVGEIPGTTGPRYGVEAVGENHAAVLGAFTSHSTNNVAAVRFGRSDADELSQYWALGMDGQATGTFDLSLTDYNLPTRYVWTAQQGTGNVGIGTANPSHKLQVGIGSASSIPATHQFVSVSDTDSKMSVANNNKTVTLSIGNGTYGEIWSYDYDASSPLDLGLQVPGGRVGIGTATPSAKLQVIGSVALKGATNNSNSRPAVGSTTITGELRAYSKNGYVADDGLLRLSAGGGTNASTKTFIDLSGQSNISDMYRNIIFGTSGTERMRLNADGWLGIGTATPTAKLHVQGDFCATGSKNAIVPTSQGMTKVYSEESAGVWFTDYGRGQLVDGLCVIELDPLFLETVTISDEYPMMVFLQEEAECNGLISRPGSTSFEVIERSDGNSDATFSYRIVAKRKGWENARLESVELAEKGGER